MKKFPNTLVIMIGAIILAWILTYIIPQGNYERILNVETQREVVSGNSYHTIDGEPLSVVQMIMAIPKGIIGRADLVVLILLCGGCFYVIEQTGALKQGLVLLTSRLKGKEEFALGIVALLFATGGALAGIQEEIIAMTPVLLFFTRGLGYNAYISMLVGLGSAVIGSAFSPMNPFAVVIAQKEAGLPFLSGSTFRLAIFLIAFICWLVIIIRYARRNKIEKEISASTETGLTRRSVCILILLGLAFVLLIFGMLYLEWGFNEISAEFFVLGILAGLIGKLGTNGTSEAYIAGFKEMTFAAVIAGLANSITVILKEGLILDSIVYGLFVPMQYLPKSISAVSMMCSHALLHFPIPTYSGQALLTMPILLPLSDLLGISRQICVLAYQYGAVLMDLLVPTNGALMAMIALSGISFNKWFAFAIKPTMIILVLSALSIMLAIAIDYK